MLVSNIFLRKLIFNKNSLILGILLALIISIGWYFYKKEEKINTLMGQVEQLDIRLQLRELQLHTLEETAKRVKSMLSKNLELQQNLRDTQALVKVTVAEELKVFEADKLKEISTKKPGLIEIKVNKATNKVFKTLEKESLNFSKDIQ